MSETDCTEFLAEIEIFLDQELNDDARCAEIQQHLEDCSPCGDRADFQATLRILVSKKCSGEATPTELHARIVQLIRTEQG